MKSKSAFPPEQRKLVDAPKVVEKKPVETTNPDTSKVTFLDKGWGENTGRFYDKGWKNNNLTAEATVATSKKADPTLAPPEGEHSLEKLAETHPDQIRQMRRYTTGSGLDANRTKNLFTFPNYIESYSEDAAALTPPATRAHVQFGAGIDSEIYDGLAALALRQLSHNERKGSTYKEIPQHTEPFTVNVSLDFSELSFHRLLGVESTDPKAIAMKEKYTGGGALAAGFRVTHYFEGEQHQLLVEWMGTVNRSVFDKEEEVPDPENPGYADIVRTVEIDDELAAAAKTFFHDTMGFTVDEGGFDHEKKELEQMYIAVYKIPEHILKQTHIESKDPNAAEKQKLHFKRLPTDGGKAAAFYRSSDHTINLHNGAYETANSTLLGEVPTEAEQPDPLKRKYWAFNYLEHSLVHEVGHSIDYASFLSAQHATSAAYQKYKDAGKTQVLGQKYQKTRDAYYKDGDADADFVPMETGYYAVRERWPVRIKQLKELINARTADPEAYRAAHPEMATLSNTWFQKAVTQLRVDPETSAEVFLTGVDEAEKETAGKNFVQAGYYLKIFDKVKGVQDESQTLSGKEPEYIREYLTYYINAPLADLDKAEDATVMAAMDARNLYQVIEDITHMQLDKGLIPAEGSTVQDVYDDLEKAANSVRGVPQFPLSKLKPEFGPVIEQAHAAGVSRYEAQKSVYTITLWNPEAAFLAAAEKDISKVGHDEGVAISHYSDKTPKELYAESFAEYIANPRMFAILRPNTKAYFDQKFKEE